MGHMTKLENRGDYYMHYFEFTLDWQSNEALRITLECVLRL